MQHLIKFTFILFLSYIFSIYFMAQFVACYNFIKSFTMMLAFSTVTVVPSSSQRDVNLIQFNSIELYLYSAKTIKSQGAL